MVARWNKSTRVWLAMLQRGTDPRSVEVATSMEFGQLSRSGVVGHFGGE